MRINKFTTNLFSVIIILVFLSGSFLIAQKNIKPSLFITKQQSSVNLDETFWRYFNLGQKRLFSSLLWIATILESDHDHYKGKDLNSWMFLRFKNISSLEPLFYENYIFGGQYLSIIKDDIDGASYIYKKGLAVYPTDLPLLRNAAFHFYYEAQDYGASEEVLKRIKQHPDASPAMLTTLARIESQNGNLEDAFSILKDAYESLKVKDSFLGVKILSQLYAIKAEIDLKCLNETKVKCSRIDIEGHTYIKNDDGIYRAKREWTPYRIKKKKGTE
jgi:hypothetical protein